MMAGNNRVKIVAGDALEELRKMPSEYFDCLVTSPPYWGLRDYGVEGQLGMESTIAEHIEHMLTVFEEVKRVLKTTGTCFVNYGDCYASKPNGRLVEAAKIKSNDDRTFRNKPFSTIDHTEKLKPKDLCMIPNRFALAMQSAGWWVRAEIIWAKPNPMPESVTDRPATAHEKIWLFTKGLKYFWDAERVRVKAKGGLPKTKKTGTTTKTNSKARGHSRAHSGFIKDWDNRTKSEQQCHGRNLRNYEPAPLEVFNIATRPFKGAHFATFPPELVERCIMAGCPENGHILDPFGGAGTTGLVAARLGLAATLIELNPQYADLARQRIDADRLGASKASVAFPQSTATSLPLFKER